MVSDAIAEGSPKEPGVKMPDVMVPDHATDLRDLSANDPFLESLFDYTNPHILSRGPE